MAQESWNNDNETGIQQPEVPVLCANNCGFFGSVTNNNLCSKCYRDYLMKQQMSAAVAPAPIPVEKPPVSDEASSSTLVQGPPKSHGGAEPSTGEKKQEEASKTPANRCALCRKKVGLTGFQCRCGGTYCSSHRYSDAHECSFDYKKTGRDIIAKQNPVVMANKIDKI